jgi:hypothetical protein
MLEPDKAEQRNANSGKNGAHDHTNGGERGEEVSALVTHESPGAGIKHQPAESSGDRRFDATRPGWQFSRQSRYRLASEWRRVFVRLVSRVFCRHGVGDL